ncbi:MAG: carboxymuconolactone decarboxylase family protein [Rhodospirillales bacterium]|nr:carboxymuconolactone decarboxylase family protein [Rhodospirillales bacterium]
MVKDWPDLAKQMTGAMQELRGGIPEVMNAFSAIAKAATAHKAMDPKTKELVALGIAIATRCDGCIAFHSKACRSYGATREEVLETVGMAIYMGGGPSVMYGALAVEAFDQFQPEMAKG